MAGTAYLDLSGLSQPLHPRGRRLGGRPVRTANRSPRKRSERTHLVTTRAKFRCNSVEQYTSEPKEVQRYVQGSAEPQTYSTWPRTFRFTTVYDTSVPED